MSEPLAVTTLTQQGLTENEASRFVNAITSWQTHDDAPTLWHKISKQLLTPKHSFSLHLYLFKWTYPEWQNHPENAPAWIPQHNDIVTSNLWQCMRELDYTSYKDFHDYSVHAYQDFWSRIIKQLGIVLQKPYTQLIDITHGIETPEWLVNAKMNIVDSCFTAAPDAIALIYLDRKGKKQTMQYDALHRLVNRISQSLVTAGYKAQDAIAIDMPMTIEAVALYLGIIQMGGIVVSIADSFSSDEIATRLQITKTKLVFTQDCIRRGTKQLPLYEKVKATEPHQIIVIPAAENLCVTLRAHDQSWDAFLGTSTEFVSVAVSPLASCNILFSSGTTGQPKGIPWNHTTAIKAASDAFFHQNIQPGDVLAWPTNLGWMMGPWLIFAGLINHATLALYADNPNEQTFGKFVQDAKVTMLGVVPTLVATWKQNHIMQGFDWSAIKVFSSTGECSNAEDMLYLMSLAGYQPVIEYCGGTEIGGSYLTSTVIENNYPAVFTTPALGIDLLLLDDHGEPASIGEVALKPPSIGLSTRLLNADHHQVYYANMPLAPDGTTLRRHGDQARRLPNGAYCMLGRADDTMNLGGIKISSAEIERALVGIDQIKETAAIAVNSKQSGPSHLVIYAATPEDLNKETMLHTMQTRINTKLNPLFKIHDIVFTKELPKTASNKIMRRILRQEYEKNR